MQDVMKALQQGWMILGADRVLAHGSVSEGQGYTVRLSSADGHWQRKVFLPDSVESRSLLATENVPMAA